MKPILSFKVLPVAALLALHVSACGGGDEKRASIAAAGGTGGAQGDAGGADSGSGGSGDGGGGGGSGPDGGGGDSAAGAGGGGTGGAGGGGTGGAGGTGSDGGGAGGAGPDGGGAGGGGAGGGGAGGAGGVGNADGGDAAPVEVCTTIQNDAPAVTTMQVAGSPPAAEGGTIQDGTYWLTALSVYTGADGGTGPLGSPTSVTLSIAGTSVQQVSDAITARFTLAVVGSEVHLTALCPEEYASGPQPPPLGYTAQGDVLTLIDPGSGQAQTFTRQP